MAFLSTFLDKKIKLWYCQLYYHIVMIMGEFNEVEDYQQEYFYFYLITTCQVSAEFDKAFYHK